MNLLTAAPSSITKGFHKFFSYAWVTTDYPYSTVNPYADPPVTFDFL